MPYPGRLETMGEEHKEIMEAIGSRNVERSQKAVRVHLENAERTLLKVIEEQNLMPSGEDEKKEVK